MGPSFLGSASLGSFPAGSEQLVIECSMEERLQAEVQRKRKEKCDCYLSAGSGVWNDSD